MDNDYLDYLLNQDLDTDSDAVSDSDYDPDSEPEDDDPIPPGGEDLFPVFFDLIQAALDVRQLLSDHLHIHPLGVAAGPIANARSALRTAGSLITLARNAVSAATAAANNNN